DPEAGRGAPGVHAMARAAPLPRIHADRDVASGECAPVTVELMERAGVVEDPLPHELLEARGRDLRRQHDPLGRESGAEGALDFGVARGIDVQSTFAKY